MWNRSTFSVCLVVFCAATTISEHSRGSDVLKSEWYVFAGTGSADSPVASKPTDPKTVALRNVYGIEVTADSIYFSTVDDHSIWKSDHQGTSLVRIAGTGELGYSGDGGPASQATFNAPHEIRVDERGNVYVADTRNHCIRRIDAETGSSKRLPAMAPPVFGATTNVDRKPDLISHTASC